jgi:hypothetical protein
MEDLKGKIRVYARTRPLTKKETDEKQKFALVFPDEFTLEHPWKAGAYTRPFLSSNLSCVCHKKTPYTP